MNATLTQSQVAAMMAAQDTAAAKFWAYPGQDWQMAFQASWMSDHGLPPFAVGPDGLAYGEKRDRP